MKKSEGSIYVLPVGLPGDMCSTFVRWALTHSAPFFFTPFALTGPETVEDHVSICGQHFDLLWPEQWRPNVGDLKRKMNINGGRLIAVDFSHKDAVAGNVDFFNEMEIPFIEGTTAGLKRTDISSLVWDAGNCAVVSPNMALPIVVVLATFQQMAKRFRGSFKGFTLKIVESHQEKKGPVPSGTALEMAGYFRELGLDFEDDQIIMVRNKEEQLALGVPPEFLDGHGWHFFHLTSPDGIEISLITKVNGRDPYAAGTCGLVIFLDEMVRTGRTRKTYSMVDYAEYGNGSAA